MLDQHRVESLPEAHRAFVENCVPRLMFDPRIVGVALGGSFLLNEIDAYSDLDLVVFIDPPHYDSVLVDRQNIVKKIGSLLESFTGEHVGEPRLLICLYGPPLLHIDFKFVSMDDIHEKVENPAVLWEREDLISSQINLEPATFPQPDPTWIEKRFWTWIHYTATKIGRGEIFEAMEAIGFLRVMVFGPLILQKKGARPRGLRKIERYASQTELQKLEMTVATNDPGDCLRALRESIALYHTLRDNPSNSTLEKLVLDYLDQIETNLD